MIKLSVILCTHNPNQAILKQVIDSLHSQTLTINDWELLIIDNNSLVPVAGMIDFAWHSDARILIEPELGLINARNRGTVEAKYPYLVSVDDDTPLFEDYLAQIQKIYSRDPELGVVGGRSYPIFLETPPSWISDFNTLLAIRDLGEKEITDQLNEPKPRAYPECAPILIAPKKACMEEYNAFFKQSLISRNLGRKGDHLASGEDNDINMFIYSKGYKLGYFPELKFYHIIPSRRTTRAYLIRMAFESNRSWVKMLSNHNIYPWKKIAKATFLPRIIKAYFKFRAWKNTPNYIRWKGVCGSFKGLSELN